MSSEAPREKTAKELEKERKKAEKLAKFEAKKVKQAAEQAVSAKKEKPKVVKDTTTVIEWVDPTVLGEKKVLASLDDPAWKAYSPKNVESSWYEWWVKQGFFEPELTAEGEIKPEGVFVVPAPPPNITGALHIGHALTVAIQDSLVRYNRMKGKTVLFLPGFDHAGISTQSVVEKMLWRSRKQTRHDLGREAFVNLVWDWKDEYYSKIKRQVQRLGASYDWTRERFTLDEGPSAAVKETFVRLHREGIIYRSSRLVNWCTALNTTLSNLEVDSKEIPGRTEISVPGYDHKVEVGVLTSFAYRIQDSDERIVIATTRPETMLGDTGIAVHPDDTRYKHLVGKFAVHPFVDRLIPIIADAEAVDIEFGTGAVKMTPAHDPNDYATGTRHGLEFITIFNEDGTLNENGGPFRGHKRFDVRVEVVEALKEQGLFVDQVDHAMTVPVCNKSGDIIEPLLKPQWWVDQKALAGDAIKAVKQGDITITPKTSEHDFFYWLNNIQDWCISRQLWWGHRIPAYFVRLEGVSKEEEDQQRADGKFWVVAYTEEEALAQAKEVASGKAFTLEQDEDVLDTWFSSGLWPFSTLGWPDNQASDLAKFYPMSLLETGWDILFFWVVRMITLGIRLTGKVPFTEVFCHSLVRDAQGRKMSKSLGNVVDPLDVIAGIPLDKLHAKLHEGNLDPREIVKAEQGQTLSFPRGIPECGTDALRFALCAYTTGGRDINLDIYRVEGYRKFCNKIYQATKFALMRLGPEYEPVEIAKGSGVYISGHESLVEQWILHRLSVAAKSVNESMDRRDFLEATSSIYNFWLNELCDVYIENSKFYFLEGNDAQKRSAQHTLYTCLDAGLRLMHPFMPFLTEELWQRIPHRESDGVTITKAAYPVYDGAAFNPEAAQAYDVVLDVVKAARSLLAQYGILKDATIIVQGDAIVDKIVGAQTSSILSLVKAASQLQSLAKDAPAPAGAVVSVVSPTCSVYIIVRGHVNFEEEIAKANDKVAKAERSKEQLLKLMNGKDYEVKAKPEAKEQNKQRLDNFEAEIAGLKQVVDTFERLRLE